MLFADTSCPQPRNTSKRSVLIIMKFLTQGEDLELAWYSPTSHKYIGMYLNTKNNVSTT